MIAICKKGFNMPRGTVTSNRNKVMDNNRFVSSGEVFSAPSGAVLIGEKGRKYDTAGLNDNFLFLGEKPACVWCALGVPLGSKKERCTNRQHAVGEAEKSPVIFITDCTAL